MFNQLLEIFPKDLVYLIVNMIKPVDEMNAIVKKLNFANKKFKRRSCRANRALQYNFWRYVTGRSILVEYHHYEGEKKGYADKIDVLRKMTIKEYKSIVKANGIKGYSKMSRKELVGILLKL